MHGMIFLELQRYATERATEDAWLALLRKAGIPDRIYQSTQEYPDSEAFALVGAAAEALGMSEAEVQTDFGAFIAPGLLRIYRNSLIAKSWKTLDLIEHTEEMIHTVVRIRNPGARPPELRVTRSGDEAVILYESARRMCAFAKGILAGVADHFGEHIEISESTCMHEGDPACTLHVRLVPRVE